MANQTPIHSRSAQPEKDKVMTVTNEFHRRYRNNSRDLPTSEIEAVIQNYVKDLKRGGFSQSWIKNALEAASVGYGRNIKSEISGGRRVNRPESFGQKRRIVKRLIGKSTWFKSKASETFSNSSGLKKKKSNRQLRGVPETILFVPHTPNGELKRALQKIDSKVNGNCKYSTVKMVETLGPKLNNSLSNTAPWRNTHCGRQGCGPCQAKEGSCKVRNCTYSITCLTCSMTYWGETHRTFGDRAREHQAAIRSEDNTNALAKHQAIHHPHQDPNFSFKLDRVWKTTLARHIGEALAIQGEDPTKLMNSKSEWGSKNTIPRIIVDTQNPTQNPTPAEAQPSSSDANSSSVSFQPSGGPASKNKRSQGPDNTASSTVDMRSFLLPSNNLRAHLGQGLAGLIDNNRKRKAN